MSVFADTSVWSLALRRDAPPSAPEVGELRRALGAGAVYSTGLVLQELLQGFPKPKAKQDIISHFAALPLLIPDRDDHIQAADLRRACRQRGVQIGTIDALLAELCVRHGLTMLTTDKDFQHVATVVPIPVWKP